MDIKPAAAERGLEQVFTVSFTLGQAALAAACVLMLALLFILVFMLRRRAAAKRGAGLHVASVHNIGRRKSQQDAFCFSSLEDAALLERRGFLAVLADGMGGMAGGEAAGRAVTQTLQEGFVRDALSADPSVALCSLLFRANEKVMQIAGSGSTAVCALVRDQHLSFASVGDSRIALMRGGALINLNRLHNYAVELDERAADGQIPMESALLNPQRHALTSYMGMANLVCDRNAEPIRLLPGDRVLLMSDGVFGTLGDEEIAACMRGSAQACAEKLEAAVLAKAGETQDNFTALILQYD